MDQDVGVDVKAAVDPRVRVDEMGKVRGLQDTVGERACLAWGLQWEDRGWCGWDSTEQTRW